MTKFIALLAGPGTLLALFWAISVGMFVGHLLGLIGAPSIVGFILGLIVFAYCTFQSVILINAVVLTQGIAGFFGLITKRGAIFATILTVLSYFFTSGILHWARVTGFEYGFTLLAWNLIVLLFALALCSGVSLAAGLLRKVKV